MKLYDFCRSSAAFRVRIGLNLKRLPAERAFIHLRRNDQTTPAYLALNPQGLVPALEEDGQVFTQSLAIIEYLDETHPEPSLLPGHPADRARVRSLAQLVACDIHPIDNLRVLRYLADPLGHDEATIGRWFNHWIAKGFDALERVVDLARRHVALQPFDIEPGGGGNLKDGLLVDLSLRRHHRSVELVVLGLLARGERRSRRIDRILAENRQLFIDNAKLAILLEQRFARRFDLLAVGAAIVEALDDGDVALGIAGDRCARIVKQLLAPFADCRARTLLALCFDLLLGGLQRLDDHLGVLQDVIVDDLLEGALLRRRGRHGSPGGGQRGKARGHKADQQAQGHGRYLGKLRMSGRPD